MKAEFTKEGYLQIIPENATEMYALKKWAEKNVNKHTPELAVYFTYEYFKEQENK